MRNLFLVSVAVLLLVGCDVSPASRTDVPTSTSDGRFHFYHGENRSPMEGPEEYFEKTYQEVTACMGVDPNAVGYVRVYLWDELKDNTPYYSYNGNHNINLPRDLDGFDQGVSHEMIHMLLKATTGSSGECPETNEHRINEKPWVCQFDWAR